MKHLYIKRSISVIVYALLLIDVIHYAFFFTPHGYNQGRAKGGSLGILLLAIIIPIGLAIRSYGKTRSVKTVLQTLKALLLALLDIPWQLLDKQLRKSRKRPSNPTKQRQATQSHKTKRKE